MHLKMSSAEGVCCKYLPNITDELSIDLGPHCLPQRLLNRFSRREKQTTFVVIGTLRIKSKVPVKHEIQVMDKSILHLMTSSSIAVYFQKFCEKVSLQNYRIHTH